MAIYSFNMTKSLHSEKHNNKGIQFKKTGILQYYIETDICKRLRKQKVCQKMLDSFQQINQAFSQLKLCFKTA